MSETGIVHVTNSYAQPIVRADALTAQVDAIQDIMRQVMRDGEHYGVIPGCGAKKVLLLPGAQKLGLAFGFSPEYTVETVDLQPAGHREYRVRCRLTHRASGGLVAEGVGCCSTMESKYRFRAEPVAGRIPEAYWQSRDVSLIGGPGHFVRKGDAGWNIYRRVEHGNPAEFWNTCLKIAKKRAYVDATITATAASDIFTQDLEDSEDVAGLVDPVSPTPPADTTAAPTSREHPRSTESHSPPPSGDGYNHVEMEGRPGMYQGDFVVQSAHKVGSGTNSRGAWNLYAIATNEGVEFTTFSTSVYEAAMKTAGTGKPARITYRISSRNGKTSYAVESLSESHTEQTGTGQSDPETSESLVTFARVETKTMTRRDGTPCMAYVFVATDGRRFGTFDDALAARIGHHLNNGQAELFVTYKQRGQQLTITGIEEDGF